MANEEVLGPRKTMFILVIVVGCFAVLWPRILSPLILGSTRDQLQPNQFDRDAGCCDVMFGTELTVLELINEVCSSAVHVNGKLSPTAAAECRKTVNDSCGVDIAAFVKRSDNIGKSAKILVQTMQSSNSSCLKEHFGVPIVNLGLHTAFNSWALTDTLKQERPPIRGSGPHPAMRERGRAIPPGAAPAPQVHIQMPPNVRVRTSPLSGYFELDIKPPPIPGMRPPLGSPGGPVPAPKTSMGFVMPIYTICIIVFFVYTISKLFFKRATIPYEPVSPDPQFRRRVFRDDSRSSPDKLVVTAISGLVAEVQQQMEAGYAQNQQRQDVQDNHTRPYTNGTIIHNSGPVHIFASEYSEANNKTSEPKEPSPEPRQPSPDPKSKTALEELSEQPEEENGEAKESTDDIVSDTEKVIHAEKTSDVNVPETITKAESTIELESSEQKDQILESPEENQGSETKDVKPSKEIANEPEVETNNLIETEPIELKKNGDIGKTVEDFLREEAHALSRLEDEAAKELLEGDDDGSDGNDIDQEKSTVKVMCVESTAHSADGRAYTAAAPAPPPAPRVSHEADEVKSIFLETAIPQQTRVLVADFDDTTRTDQRAHTHSPMVVSGKMTLSLIQDATRDTPERDLESTMDDFTTASALTQPAQKDGSESEEEIEEEEIEVEEIEEEEEEEIEQEQEIEVVRAALKEKQDTIPPPKETIEKQTTVLERDSVQENNEPSNEKLQSEDEEEIIEYEEEEELSDEALGDEIEDKELLDEPELQEKVDLKKEQELVEKEIENKERVEEEIESDLKEEAEKLNKENEEPPHEEKKEKMDDVEVVDINDTELDKILKQNKTSTDDTNLELGISEKEETELKKKEQEVKKKEQDKLLEEAAKEETE